MGSAPTRGTPKSEHQTKDTEAIAGGHQTIAPYMIVNRGAEFIDFVKNAFGATERFRVGRGPGSDLIMHAEVSIGDSTIELGDAYG